MKRISTKLIVLLVAAALLPLTLFGLLSIRTARTTAFQEVNQGHLAVAKQAADQIRFYVADRVAILQALAQHLGQTDLRPWQKERIIKNYVIQFDEYRQIALTDLEGRELAASRLGAPLGNRSVEPAFQAAVNGSLYRSPVFLSDNLTPSMTIAVPVMALGRVTGVLIGEVNLIAMWNLVDSIRIGREGYAFVVSETGQLLAHGRGAGGVIALLDGALGCEAAVALEEQLDALPTAQLASGATISGHQAAPPLRVSLEPRRPLICASALALAARCAAPG